MLSFKIKANTRYGQNKYSYKCTWLRVQFPSSVNQIRDASRVGYVDQNASNGGRLHSDRYPHCNSRTNFTNLAKHFAVHGSWNIWVDVPAIITACYISQFGYESREIHCKLQVLSVYMCPYINTTAINEQRRVAETPWQHPTGGNLFGGM